MAQILVADDHKDFRDAVRLMLEQKGHHVVEAQDGKDAVLLCRSLHPDLVILDIFMPKKDGIAAMWQMRFAYEDIKLIVVSAGGESRSGEIKWSSKDALELARQFGVNRVLAKPVEPEVLLSAVESTLHTPDRLM